MNNKTLETALLYLSGGCLFISILEIVTRGLGFGYLWLMISAILFLAYTLVKRRRLAQAPESNKPGLKGTKTPGSGGQARHTASKTKRKRR